MTTSHLEFFSLYLYLQISKCVFCILFLQEMIITELQAETTYSVTVAAYTTKGDGARSKPKLITTTGAGNESITHPFTHRSQNGSANIPYIYLKQHLYILKQQNNYLKNIKLSYTLIRLSVWSMIAATVLFIYWYDHAMLKAKSRKSRKENPPIYTHSAYLLYMLGWPIIFQRQIHQDRR